MTTLQVEPAARLEGELTVPGDKSISHRALILGALARGRSYIGNCSPAADVASTAACLRACGASVRDFGDGRLGLDGDGTGAGLRSPEAALDCGNSGTTMRLLAGLLAGHQLEAILDGDGSLRSRPMERVAAPLRAMGAAVDTAGGRPPLRLRGRSPLRGLSHRLPVASAQVKSAILLAGLAADAATVVEEPSPSRDHTERLLRMCGIRVDGEQRSIQLSPGPLHSFGLRIPADLSSAAFAACLAAALPGSRLRLPGVTLNPGRTGVLDVLHRMGAGVAVEEAEAAGGAEPCGAVEVSGGDGLRGVVVDGDLIPRCIDELPVLAVLATQAEGVTEIRDAAELRMKESDRLAGVAAGLRAMGAAIEELPAGLAVRGPVRLRPARLSAAGDHRLAMAWAVAGMLARGGSTAVEGAEAVGTSYPGFFADLRTVTRPA